MTIELYEWSTKEQIDELVQYLLQYPTASAVHLNYLLGTGLFSTAPLGELKIWSSHRDPLHTKDIVIWIYHWKHLTRLFTSSELKLQQASYTKEARTYAYGERRKVNNPAYRYFESDEDEVLYRKTLDMLDQVVPYFFEKTFKDSKETVVCDSSVLWLSSLYKHFKIGSDVPHSFCVRKASEPIDEVKLPDHLERTDKFSKADFSTIQSRNALPLDMEYLEDCSRIAAGVRTKDTKQLVAWTVSHRQLATGALHVLPDYRRQGLAEIVLADLCKQHVRFFQNRLPNVPLSKLHFSAYVNPENKPSLTFFKKAGFEPLGLGASWVQLSKL